MNNEFDDDELSEQHSVDEFLSHDIRARAAELIAMLTQYQKTVAVAESLTGGLVCAALTSIPGASAVVRGGVIAYATDAKTKVLGVDSELLAENGPVDDDVVAEMVTQVVEKFDADFGVATTGVAGPDPQNDKPVGFVLISTWADDAVDIEEFLFEGDRDAIREQSVLAALDALEATLDEWVENEFGPDDESESVE